MKSSIVLKFNKERDREREREREREERERGFKQPSDVICKKSCS